MKRSDAPAKQPVPFGVNGTRESLLATAQPSSARASYDAGFPPITMTAKASGGLPPKGPDFNQILYELSDLGRWGSAGALQKFDATFSTAISGYPEGALLMSDDSSAIYLSTVDDNTANPNADLTGWVNLGSFLGADTTLRSDLASSYSGDGSSLVAYVGDENVYDVLQRNVDFNIVGLISSSPTVNSSFDLVEDSSGLTWSYIGSSSFPFVVNPAVVPNTSPDWQLVFIRSFIGPDNSFLSNTTINSVTSSDGTTVTYAVNSTSNFVVGNYALIHATNRLGLIYCGVFKVTGVGSGTISVSQNNSRIAVGATEGTVYASAMNNIITSYNGALVVGRVKSLSGFVIDGGGTAHYGLRAGGTHNVYGNRLIANVGMLSRSGFVNLNTSNTSVTDDVVGILAANGSVIGVNRVAVNGSKIGIESYRNSCIMGDGAFITNCNNDAFKNEFTCNVYLYYCHASNCGSAYSSRYSAGAEYATMVAINCQFGAISQFNAYNSVRDFLFYQCTSAAIYATDSSYMYQRGGDIVNCNSSFRSYQQSVIESAGSLSTDPITESGNSSGYDIQNSSFRHSTRVISGAAPIDYWDAKGEVLVNGVNPAIVSQVVSTTVAAQGRAAYNITFSVKFPTLQSYRAYCYDSTLVEGLIIDAQPRSTTGLVTARLYINNISSSAITLSSQTFYIKAV